MSLPTVHHTDNQVEQDNMLYRRFLHRISDIFSLRDFVCIRLHSYIIPQFYSVHNSLMFLNTFGDPFCIYIKEDRDTRNNKT